ncbi:MAG TPA: phospholipase D-like domain-containing protein, partial [Candidatus Obscuribacter sp.]|nr:phospholipase D-like domain-containing protein [Candidatus Obscuribacter sp.]
MIKTRLRQALLALTMLVMTFGAGTWYGHSLPKSGVDPQDYIETVFTPYQSGLAAYLNFLDGTKHSLRIASYSLTEESITDKLIELKGRGVKDIIVLVDKSQTLSGGRNKTGLKYQQEQVQRLRDAGIEVVIGTSEKRGQIMHLKATVRDGEWVEDGSWNYSGSADFQ